MIFVPCNEHNFIVSQGYFWLCNQVENNKWYWTYNPRFGIQFENEEDAIIFRLKFGDI